MSQAMTVDQLTELFRHIRCEHGISNRSKGKMVKYLDPAIDMRDGKVFAVKMRGYGWEESFHTQNECRELPDSLFTRIMRYLDED